MILHVIAMNLSKTYEFHMKTYDIFPKKFLPRHLCCLPWGAPTQRREGPGDACDAHGVEVALTAQLQLMNHLVPLDNHYIISDY